VLVALVLLIACANVANLMTAQGMARAREMAIRVSVGAGRFRLGQMVLVESAWIAVLATAGGVLFAWWAAPFVVRMISAPDDPARLFLSSDWRVLGFGVALTVGVTFLFGLGPALRVTKGGQVGNLPHLLLCGLSSAAAGRRDCVPFRVAGLFVVFRQRGPIGARDAVQVVDHFSVFQSYFGDDFLVAF